MNGYTLSIIKVSKGAPLNRIKRGLDINIFNRKDDLTHLLQINVENCYKIRSEE